MGLKEAERLTNKAIFDKSVVITALKLAVIVAFVVLMLAVVNAFTKDKIAANEAEAGDIARRALIADAAVFEVLPQEVTPTTAAGTVNEIYAAKGEDGSFIAFCVDVTAMGFGSDGIGMVVAVSQTGQVLGVRVTSSTETSGIGSKVVDRTNETGQAEAVSGATVTSKGIENGVMLAVHAVAELKGGA